MNLSSHNSVVLFCKSKCAHLDKNDVCFSAREVFQKGFYSPFKAAAQEAANTANPIMIVKLLTQPYWQLIQKVLLLMLIVFMPFISFCC